MTLSIKKLCKKDLNFLSKGSLFQQYQLLDYEDMMIKVFFNLT